MENNAGNRIAVIGDKIFGGLTAENFNEDDFKVELFRTNEWAKVEDLVSYTLCIVDYEAFRQTPNSQNTFVKQMLDALNYGGIFCFVYFEEEAASQKSLNNNLYRMQVGYQVLYDFKLGKVSSKSTPFHSGKVFRDELNPFLKKWGSSKLFFHSLNSEVEELYTHENAILGFTCEKNKGRLIYLPFLRDLSKLNTVKEGLKTLISCLLNYIVKSRTSLPRWANEHPFFNNEIELYKRKDKLLQQLSETENKLEKFVEAKSLLFQSEYKLESSLPNFLRDKLGLKIEQIEEFIEDFWLVDENDKRLAIAEIKSRVKGFTKGLIGYVVAHRDHYEYDDDFPAILFVNCNLRVGSWKDKDKKLNKAEYESAANQSVLVVRVEDVVRLWEMKRRRKIDNKKILEYFLKSKGWLHVDKDLKIEVLPRPKKKKAKS